MNKMLIKITGIFLILSISGIYANPNGKNIFNSKGCTACHQPNADALGPSLKQIIYL
jgi:cytochrome c